MSLSRVFKGQDGFKAEQLVPRPSSPEKRWQAVAVADPSRPLASQEPSSTISSQPQPPTDQNRQQDETDRQPAAEPENQASKTVPPEADDEQPAAVATPAAETPPAAVDLEELRREAYQEGLQQGRQTAMEQAEADFGSALAAMQQTCEQLSNIRETILKNSRNELIELVFALAEKIIRHSVREQDRTILATVEEALNQAVRSSEFSIYLHPDDMAVIKERAPEFIAGLNGIEHLAVKADGGIEQGGCRIESETCTVDATIAGQLDIIRDQIRETL